MVVTAVAIALHWDMALQAKITSYIPPVLIENNSAVKSAIEGLQGKQGAVSSNIKEDTLGNYGKAPEIVGIINWINSPPLSLMDLQGKVVLIDFWTYSCINCVRTLPYLEKWYADYKDHGLVIIGVHTPEFEFEKDPTNVAAAALRLGVKYPIAQDNDYKTWVAYHNHFWPADYLIDKDGNLRMVHYGEGDYAGTENAIRELLGMAPEKIAEVTVSERRVTPEIYLGMERGKSYTPENSLQLGKVADYDYKTPLKSDQVGLKGKWKVEEQRITSESSSSYLDLNFLAGQVYLVLGGSSSTKVQVYVDRKLSKEFPMDRDRMYTLVDMTYGMHQLSLKIPEGVSAYAFTFGDQH